MNYKLIVGWFCLLLLSACNSKINSSDKPFPNYTDIKIDNGDDYLVAIFKNESRELGDSIGFVNKKGDTIIPIGKYSHCWTDTIRTFAIVFDKKNTKGETVAIDKQENVLFDIVFFDNWPDEIRDGLFRVKRYGKIGFANSKGQIVIPCQYECAFRFEEGKAKVAYKCTIEANKYEEYQVPQSNEWFYIDVNGNKVN